MITHLWVCKMHVLVVLIKWFLVMNIIFVIKAIVKALLLHTTFHIADPQKRLIFIKENSKYDNVLNISLT